MHALRGRAARATRARDDRAGRRRRRVPALDRALRAGAGPAGTAVRRPDALAEAVGARGRSRRPTAAALTSLHGTPAAAARKAGVPKVDARPRSGVRRERGSPRLGHPDRRRRRRRVPDRPAARGSPYEGRAGPVPRRPQGRAPVRERGRHAAHGDHRLGRRAALRPRDRPRGPRDLARPVLRPRGARLVRGSRRTRGSSIEPSSTPGRPCSRTSTRTSTAARARRSPCSTRSSARCSPTSPLRTTPRARSAGGPSARPSCRPPSA